MREILNPVIAGILYSIIIGFSFSFRNHLVTYLIASILIIPAGYYFKKISSLFFFLLIPLMLILVVLLVNSYMFNITIPITGIGMTLGYLTGFSIYHTRHSFWKWIILAVYLSISVVIAFYIIPRWLLWYTVEYNKQTLFLPANITSLTDKNRQIDLKNKIIVIEFWQSSCSSCLKQFPILERVQEKYKSNPEVVIVAMNNGNEKEEKARATFLGTKSKLTAAIDLNHQVGSQLSVKMIPVIFIIDRNKQVHWKHNGYITEVKDILDTEIIKHIEEILED